MKTHRGKRKGAGDPVNVAAACPSLDMLELLQGVALGTIRATPLQVRAAIAAVQYTHTKTHDGGGKEKAAAEAMKPSGTEWDELLAPMK